MKISGWGVKSSVLARGYSAYWEALKESPKISYYFDVSLVWLVEAHRLGWLVHWYFKDANHTIFCEDRPEEAIQYLEKQGAT